MVRAERGLRGIVAGKSAISLVDGTEGRLLYRGYDIADLARHSSFEETAYLVWHGDLPSRERLDAFRGDLARARPLTKAQRDLLEALPRDALPMEVLRTLVSHMALEDPDKDDHGEEANLRKAVRLVAQVPSMVAAYHRTRQGKAVVPPPEGTDTASAFLAMLHGDPPGAEAARAFDVCLLLHVDHEFNASTFAARVTAATLSDLYSAITSAVGALKGPLHGGANENVMRMLLAIQTPEAAEEHVVAALGRKERIPGFGHPVYKTMDPRAVILKEMSQRLGKAMGEPQWYEISARIEEIMMRERGLYPNVDFYSASTLHALGIPHDLFSTFFAMGRLPGWIAHVLEQYGDNRIIRPLAEYVGPKGLRYVPLDRR